MDSAKIEKEAKQLLDKFAKALEKVEKEKGDGEVSFVDREEFERKEKEGRDYDSGFKKKILDNAPAKDDDFIIAERGGWK
jgi:predicted Asp-tRNA(Asn)/Glu-tRNA(Gln) amidotransferase subunit C